MLLGRIAGTVVASRKEPLMEGWRLLVVQQLGVDNEPTGGYVVGERRGRRCGVGEFVLYASGCSARQTEVTKDRPCDAVIMAIVDTWEIGGEQRYHKAPMEEHGSPTVTERTRRRVAEPSAACPPPRRCRPSRPHPSPAAR